MNILVTGGAGFIGSHLSAALVAQGLTVTVLDNLSTGKQTNLDGLPVRLIVADVGDYAAVVEAAQGCEVIFHQAAMVSVPRSIVEPQLNHQSNVTGVFNVFEAARQAGVRRVVYASSAAVYGDEPSLPKRETSPIAPLTPYSAAKYMSEVYAAAYSAAYPNAIQFVGLRYMNVFGPRQDPSSPYSGVLSIFCQAVLAGRTCQVHGDGEQTRDFIFVSDVVQANLLAAAVDLGGKPAVFNIGRGQQTSLNMILRSLEALAGRPLPVTHGPERHGDIRHSVADISLARERLGFDPQVEIQDGLRQTLDWFRASTVPGWV